MNFYNWSLLFILILIIFINNNNEYFINYNKECASLCANNVDCDAYLVNPTNRQCISYSFSKNKQLNSNYDCSPFKNGQFYGNIKNNINTLFNKILVIKKN